VTSPQSKSRQILRIVDANFNRIGEGLRLLEEIARLMLDDSSLTQQLKTLRHDLIRSDSAFNRQMLQARKADSDVGTGLEVPGEGKEKDVALLLVANARRVQESLRTLEELAKTPETAAGLDSDKFKQARFSLYTIEQELMSGLTGKDRLRLLSGLYVIVDTEMLKGRDPMKVAGQAIKGGATTIQLRDKVGSKREILPVAEKLRALCAEKDALFIVNDYLDITLAVDADGIHLGQDDLPVAAARRILPPGRIIGCSASSVEEAVAAQAGGADYIAVGAIYPTASKKTTTTPAVVVGLETLRRVREAVSVPLVAIGSINKDNAAEVIAAGADSLAVISAVLGAESPEKAARQIIERIGAR
jgi:thiamine-phosphate pyrophosphorylase